MDEAEIVVIGAGPAGSVAAMHLADAGVRVLLVDDKPEPGGTAFPPTADDEAGFLWPDRAYRGAALRQALRVREGRYEFRGRSRVESIASGPSLMLRDLDNGETTTLSPRAVIVATGARPIASVLPGSTLAGVTGLDDPAKLVETARERPGARIALAGAGPLLWIAAAQCLSASLRVVALVDAAAKPGLRHVTGLARQPRLFAQGLGWMRAIWNSNAPVARRSRVTAIIGDDRIRAIEFAALDDAWRPAGKPRRVDVDLLGIGFGLWPDVAILERAGIAMDHDPITGLDRPGRNADMETSQKGVFVAGDAAEIAGLDAALAEGVIVAEAALSCVGRRPSVALMDAAKEARRQRQGLAPFLAALNDWSAPRAALIGDGQRDR